MLTDTLYKYREQKLAQLINNYLDYRCEEELYDFIRETIEQREKIHKGGMKMRSPPKGNKY